MERADLESHRRSIAKAISWRIAATAITASVAWLVTGEIGFAATIALADSALKIGSFYLHERAWNRVNFGRAKPREYQE